MQKTQVITTWVFIYNFYLQFYNFVKIFYLEQKLKFLFLESLYLHYQLKIILV